MVSVSMKKKAPNVTIDVLKTNGRAGAYVTIDAQDLPPAFVANAIKREVLKVLEDEQAATIVVSIERK